MGNESSSIKKAFEKLDRDHSGQLTLEEILAVQNVPGLEYFYNSLWLLYKFNKSKHGTINYHEFEKLILYIKSIVKYMKDKRDTRPKSKMWIPITRKTAKREYKLSRDSSTPIITGQMPEDDSSSDDSSSSTEGEEISEHIYIETSDFFDKTIESEQGRQGFITWLFNLTDYDKKGLVSIDKLVILIRALRLDGINPEDLTYDSEIKQKIHHLSEDSQDYAIAEQLITEYSATNDTNFITEKEFEVLAKIILKNYELRYDMIDERNEDGIYKIIGYTLKAKLGKGSAGVVRLAVEHKTGERKAIKIVPKGNIADLSRLDTEIKAMMMLHHERVLLLEQVIESESEVFFVMEYCGGGSLLEYLNGNPLSENLVRYYFSQIVSGVGYCHSKGVAHRDLKLGNILLDNTAHIKISDFGHAGIYQKGWDLFATPLVGSICNITPEQILGQSYSGEKHDIWSLGIILYTMLVGLHPFKTGNPQTFLDNIKNVNYSLPEFLSEGAKSLISSLLVADSDLRPTCKEILKHEWFKNGELNAHLLSSFIFTVPIGTWKHITASEGLCKILKKVGVEPIYTEDSIQIFEDERKYIKCHWIEKDIKFRFSLKEEQEEKEIFEFCLKSGGSVDFLSLMPKLKNGILKQQWKHSKGDVANSMERECMELFPNPEIVPVIDENGTIKKIE